MDPAVERILRGVYALDLDASLAVPTAAKALAHWLYDTSGKLPPASDLLVVAAQGMDSLGLDLEASASRKDAHAFWNRPRLHSVMKYPHCGIGKFSSHLADQFSQVQMKLHLPAWQAVRDSGMKSEFLESLRGNEEYVARLEKGVNPFSLNAMYHSGGRCFYRGSMTPQGPKEFRYCLRTAIPYSCTQKELEESFQEAKNWNDALQAVNEPIVGLDGLLRYNEGLAAMEWLGHGHSTHIPWVDMSSSVTWLMAVLLGDHQLLGELASGDFYSQAGKAFPKERSIMSPKMFRTFMKRLVMLASYNITGYGLTRSLYENERELFNLLWAMEGRGDQTNEDEIKLFDKYLSICLGRFLARYPSIKEFRQWSLNHGRYGPRKEIPAEVIKWTLGGEKRFFSSWGWSLKESWEDVKTSRASNPNELSLRFLKQEPLSSESCRDLTTSVRYQTRYGTKTVRVQGASHGWGMKARGLGPVLIHSLEAATVLTTASQIMANGSFAATIHDSGSSTPQTLNQWDEGFKALCPGFAEELRKQFPTLPVKGIIKTTDLDAVGKIFR